jgi:hypothetical protein
MFLDLLIVFCGIARYSINLIALSPGRSILFVADDQQIGLAATAVTAAGLLLHANILVHARIKRFEKN